MPGEAYAVIGGEGFVGHALVTALHAKYPTSTVLSLDVIQRHFPEKQAWTYVSCDLTASSAGLAAIFTEHKVGCVIHTASPWIASPKEVCEKVNVQGTQNVVDACTAAGVTKLVYTSSAGVVYDGHDLINIDERCVFPDKPLDQYNDTKARAENIVLEANGKEGLLTCAIRPAGIFGPGDRQNIPGFIKAYKAGKHKVMMGSNENLFDLTYVGNVVHAHLLAAEKLGTSVPASVFDDRLKPTSPSLPRRRLPTSVDNAQANGSAPAPTEGEPILSANRNRFDQWFDLQSIPESDKDTVQLPIAGEAYFVSNGEPLPFWSWARAIWQAYSGHDRKMFALPPDIGLAFVTLENWYCWLVGKESTMPIEKVYYSITKRTYNIEKARRMLGYEPIVGVDEGLKLSIQWYKDNEAAIEAAPAPKKG